jgi:very-short-patch-repair endonuclease
LFTNWAEEKFLKKIDFSMRERARKLRAVQTDPERILWGKLKKRQSYSFLE